MQERPFPSEYGWYSFVTPLPPGVAFTFYFSVTLCGWLYTQDILSIRNRWWSGWDSQFPLPGLPLQRYPCTKSGLLINFLLMMYLDEFESFLFRKLRKTGKDTLILHGTNTYFFFYVFWITSVSRTVYADENERGSYISEGCFVPVFEASM